ncbi:MAG: hypothetical protein FJ109_05395 [Deltaproteobacteria bacterium]|nr:hypothetical protein [Deltaproteobacteria bacterium]
MAEIATWYCRRCFEPFGPGTIMCPEHQLKLVEVKDPGTSIVGEMVDGKYKVESVLGIGGMGTVFRARQMPIEREVALKILNHGLIRDKTGVKRFIQEAQAASSLKSRYSAMVYDFGLSYEGYLYFTMELVGGKLLSEVLQQEKRLPLERTLHVAIDVCRSLEEAHLRGIIHRDIKGGNIMLSELDGHEIGKVLDFGTAELMATWKKTSKLTDLGKVHGTAEYMSPEQAQAKSVTVATDFYSLGVTIYEMLAGHPPFTGPAAIPVLLSHVNEAPRPLIEAAPDGEITPELNELVMRLLQKSPEARYQSAEELRFRLEEILEDVAGPLSGEALRLHLARSDVQPRRRNMVIFDTVVQRHGARRAGGASTPVTPSRPIQQTMTLDPQQLWRDSQGRSGQEEGITDPFAPQAGPGALVEEDTSPRQGEPRSAARTELGPGTSGDSPLTIADVADVSESKTPTVRDMPALARRRSWAVAASIAAILLGIAVGGMWVLLYPEHFGISLPGQEDGGRSGPQSSVPRPVPAEARGSSAGTPRTLPGKVPPAGAATKTPAGENPRAGAGVSAPGTGSPAAMGPTGAAGENRPPEIPPIGAAARRGTAQDDKPPIGKAATLGGAAGAPEEPGSGAQFSADLGPHGASAPPTPAETADVRSQPADAGSQPLADSSAPAPAGTEALTGAAAGTATRPVAAGAAARKDGEPETAGGAGGQAAGPVAAGAAARKDGEPETAGGAGGQAAPAARDGAGTTAPAEDSKKTSGDATGSGGKKAETRKTDARPKDGKKGSDKKKGGEEEKIRFSEEDLQ